LSLHGASAGKSDYKEERKESFSHGASVNNPQDRSQRISNGSRFSAGKKQDRCASASHVARKKRCLGEACGLDSRKLSLVERGGSLRYNRAGMLDMFLGCLKWAAVG